MVCDHTIWSRIDPGRALRVRVLRTWRADAVRWLWLAHLSRTNNTRKLALSSMQQSLRAAGANLTQLHISVLSHEMGGSWDSTRLWQDAHLWEMS